MDIETRHIPTTQNAESFEFSVIPKECIQFSIREKGSVLLSTLDKQVQDTFSNHSVTRLSITGSCSSLGEIFVNPFNENKCLCCTYVDINFDHANEHDDLIETLSDQELSDYIQSFESEKQKFIQYVKSFSNDLYDVKVFKANIVEYSKYFIDSSRSWKERGVSALYTEAVTIYMKSPNCDLFCILNTMRESNRN